jgi:hypothetical protein
MCRQTIAVLVFMGLVGMPGLRPAVSAAEPDQTKKLALARLEIARRGLEAAEKTNATGEVSYTYIRIWSQRVLEAELAAGETADDRIAALDAAFQRARKLENLAAEGYRRGAFSLLEYLEAQYTRADIEYLLAKEKAKKDEKPK